MALKLLTPTVWCMILNCSRDYGIIKIGGFDPNFKLKIVIDSFLFFLKNSILIIIIIKIFDRYEKRYERDFLDKIGNYEIINN